MSRSIISAAVRRALPTRPTFTSFRPGHRRGFAFNIYDESPKEMPEHLGTPQEIAEAIFLQHASAGSGAEPAISAGTPFRVALISLTKDYPQLKGLEVRALEGRAFECFDTSRNGLIERDEFITGVDCLLNPSKDSKRFYNLAKRLEQARIGDVPSSFEHVKRVAIVGGGVAGLQTARGLTRIGKEVTIFEKSDNVGGVWRANYDNFGLQVPRELYEFPEFPYPEGVDWEKFPKGPQVQEYIERYADHFGLRSLIRFNAGVSTIQVGPNGEGWTINFGAKDANPTSEDFDFVVIATGMYGWPPHIPRIRGDSTFEGEIYHSANFFDAKVCEGKNVVVIGGGKSAVDNAVSGGHHGKSSTLVFRSAHWPVPRHLCNLVPFKWGTYSRFGHFMLPLHCDVSPFAKYLHGLLSPLKWLWWRVVELMFRAQFRLSGDLLPDEPIELDVFGGGQILNYDFRNMLKKGEVQAIKGAVERLHGKEVELQDGQTLPCDVLVFGTGFTKNYGLLDISVQEKLNIQSDGLFLYKNIMPPSIPNMAFIGAEVSTFNNILTHALQAEWLARLLDGKIPIASRVEQLVEVEKVQAWKRTWMPPTSARASIWQLHMMKYHDDLLKSMGENHLRKGGNKLAEMFSPYCAADYRDIFAEEPSKK